SCFCSLAATAIASPLAAPASRDRAELNSEQDIQLPFREERPLRLFATPEPVETILAEVPDGPPQIFRWRRMQHQVARSEGPERIAMEWWI
ncbi:DNA polymerase Y family protein, partial [Rhizobium ruizarguesonis]